MSLPYCCRKLNGKLSKAPWAEIFANLVQNEPIKQATIYYIGAQKQIKKNDTKKRI